MWYTPEMRQSWRGSHFDCESLESRQLFGTGEPDYSFGDFSRTRQLLPTPGSDTATALSAMPDGRVIVGGFTDTGWDTDTLAFSRHLPNGALDPTFGVGGLLRTTAFGGFSSPLVDILANSDGSFFTISRTAPPQPVRYFDSVGQPHQLLSSLDQSALRFGRELVRTQDGGALAVFREGLLKMRADGSPDPSFGLNGLLVFTSRTATSAFGADAVFAMTDGSFIVLGVQQTGSGASGPYFVGIRRFHSSGHVDTSFAPGSSILGVALLPGTSGTSSLRGYDIDRQSDGKWIISARTSAGYGVFRLNQNFALDASFNPFGSTPGMFSLLNRTFEGVAIQQNDSILVDGVRLNVGGGFPSFQLRLTPNGALDSTFSGDGIDDAPYVSSETSLSRVELRPDGTFFRTGTFLTTGFRDAALIRFNAAGEKDSSFATGGFVRADWVGNAPLVSKFAARQADGKLLTAGFEPGYGSWITRQNADGSPDDSFGQQGAVKLRVGLTTYSYVYGMKLLADQKIAVLASGNTGPLTGGLFLVRLLPNGAPDPSFGTNGALNTGLTEYDYVIFDLDAAGRAYLANRDRNSDPLTVHRLNADGGIDTTFGNNGVVEFSPAYVDDSVSQIAVDSFGRLILLGRLEVSDTDPTVGFVARLTNSGALDLSFGTGGFVRYQMSENLRQLPTVLKFRDNGTLWVAGRIYGSALGDRFFVQRLLDNGLPDPDFSGDGIADFAVAPTVQTPVSFVERTDGTLALAATFDETSQVNDRDIGVRLFVLEADGSPRLSFGRGGWLPVRFPTGDETAVALFEGGPGKLLLAAGEFQAAQVQTDALNLPSVASASFDANRRIVTATFSEDVVGGIQSSLAGSLTSPFRAGGSGVPTTLRWSHPFNTNGSMNQTLTFTASTVIDPAGNQMAADFRFTFHLLPGDFNRDRRTDINDFATLASKFGKFGYFTDGDANYDTVIDTADFAILAGAFNASVPPPAARSLGNVGVARTTNSNPFAALSLEVFGDESASDVLE